MKKLILMLFALVMATAINAAQVTWGLSAIEYVGNVLNTDNYSQFTAYLFNSADLASTEFEKAFNENSLSSKATASTQLGYDDYVHIDWNGNAGTKSIDKIDTAGSYNFYTVIVDANGNYLMTGSKDVTWNGQQMSVISLDWEFADELDPAVSWQKVTPVPEPTSGLLLLVGGALLALRRKQK